jgi:hypothetical protein
MGTVRENLHSKRGGESGHVPGGPEVRDHVLLDLLAVNVDGMNQAHGRFTVARHGLRDIKFRKGAEQLPALSVLLPDLVLFPSRHTHLECKTRRRETLITSVFTGLDATPLPMRE